MKKYSALELKVFDIKMEEKIAGAECRSTLIYNNATDGCVPISALGDPPCMESIGPKNSMS